jgi:hypothetical protein
MAQAKTATDISGAPSPGALVDLDRYPLDQPESASAQAMVAALAGQLRDDGLCLLPGFLTKAATTLLAVEALAPESISSAWLSQKLRMVGRPPEVLKL